MPDELNDNGRLSLALPTTYRPLLYICALFSHEEPVDLVQALP